MKPAVKKQTLHVISATHWDREWTLPFMSYRRHLVHYTDQLLEIMRQNPAFKHYHMDAQVICMEDYLRLRPEKTRQLTQLIKAGRILVGPWYTLPDIPIIHSEAIARNLLLGIEVSDSLGGAMLEGYTPCSNGQIAQLPQIYNGFGIRSAILYKGIADEPLPKEFCWRSPNGSELLTIHLTARYARANFYCLLYQEVIANVIHDTPDHNWSYAPQENKLPFRIAGQTHHDPYVYEALHNVEGWHPKYLKPYLQKLRAQTSVNAATSHLIGFHGMDHTPPYPSTPKLIAAARKLFPDLDVVDDSIPGVIAAIRRELGNRELPVHTGEMRDANRGGGALCRALYWPTLSAHLDIKTENRKTEHLLIDTAEPIATWAWLCGAEYPTAFLTDAWKLLLANHAHDSIDGCSLNKVVGDIMGRFSDCQAICEGVIQDATKHLMHSGKSVSRQPNPWLVIFNPLPYRRGGFCDLEVDIPGETPAESLRLVTEDGHEIIPHIEHHSKWSAYIQALVTRPMPSQRYRVQFEVPAIPGLAWTRLKVITTAAPAAEAGLATAPNVLENKFIKATFREDGRVDLLHKPTGKNYTGLHFFEDVGDSGDPWKFSPTGKPNTPTGPAKIQLIENTPWRAVIQVELQWDTKVTSQFSLTRTGLYLEVSSTIENKCRDHRLRVCFPTGIITDKTYAGGQFSVDERATHLPDMSGWTEKIDGYPNFGFAGLTDGKAGLAILNLGLPEYFITGSQRNVLTLTLLRATQLRRWPTGVGDALSVGAQMLGSQTVRYAIYPHAGSWADGEVLQEYRQFACPLILSEMIGEPPAAPRAGLLELSSTTLEIACIKKAQRENSLVVRVWNPFATPQTGQLKLGVGFKKAFFTDLNETRQTAIKSAGKRGVKFTVQPHQIVTLLFSGIIGN
ncbi:MAG: glycoside hydrolase family 38 C-terminal domain-containing protein [Verrucomicrobiota bacterium]